MRPGEAGPEQILEIHDPRAGLTGFLVIDSTRLGPAFGGIRLRPYAHERDALLEAIDLAATMTLKAAFAGLRCGGGKLVLIDGPRLKREPMLRLVGEMLNDLKGRFCAGRDYGMSRADLHRLRVFSRFVADEPIRVPPSLWPDPGSGGPRGAIDLGDATARGAIAAVRAALAYAGRPAASVAAARPARSAPESGATSSQRRAVHRGTGLSGARIAVQGLGSVGLPIVRRLVREGAIVTAADPDPMAARRGARAGARIVPVGSLALSRVDVLIPAALGGTLDATFAARCRAAIVCGPANHALSSHEVERELVRRGVVVVPDSVAGAGALIAGVLHQLEGETDLGPAIDRIGDRVLRLVREAGRRKRLPSELVRLMAEQRLRRGR